MKQFVSNTCEPTITKAVQVLQVLLTRVCLDPNQVYAQADSSLGPKSSLRTSRQFLRAQIKFTHKQAVP